jgi:hypothetical protein
MDMGDTPAASGLDTNSWDRAKVGGKNSLWRDLACNQTAITPESSFARSRRARPKDSDAAGRFGCGMPLSLYYRE